MRERSLRRHHVVPFHAVLASLLLATSSASSEPSMPERVDGPDPPRSLHLEDVARRIVTGRCRMVIVGDSLTQVTGSPPIGSRFAQGILRNWKPDHWLGCDAAANTYDLAGTWFASRIPIVGVTHHLAPGLHVQPGENNDVLAFAGTTPLGFHLNWLHASDIEPGASGGALYRLHLGAGGPFLATSWRDRRGDHRLFEDGASFAFTPYWYVPGDAAADGAAFVSNVQLELTQGLNAFAWTATAVETHVPDVAPGEVGLAWGRATGTLATMPESIDDAGLLSYQGPGVAIVPPDARGAAATWGELVGDRRGRFLLAGCAFERTDTPSGRGLWVGSIANGGWRATNHRYEPNDAYARDAFTPPYFANYRDEALLEYMRLFRVDTVMVLLGVNDSGMGGSDSTPAGYRANIAAVLDRARTAHAAARALDPSIQPFRAILVAPAAGTPFAERRERIAEYAEELRLLAGGDVAFIDLHADWLAAFGEYDAWAETYLSDGVHPNVAGQDEMSGRMWRMIVEAFEAGGGIADLDGNGVVDGADLGILLAEWGGPGAADLDGDGVVTGADLGLLLGAWS